MRHAARPSQPEEQALGFLVFGNLDGKEVEHDMEQQPLQGAVGVVVEDGHLVAALAASRTRRRGAVGPVAAKDCHVQTHTEHRAQGRLNRRRLSTKKDREECGLQMELQC